MKSIGYLWQLSFAVILFSILQSCDSHCINGKGNTVTQNRTPGSFSEISFSTVGSIYISQDSITSLSVMGQQNVLDDLITDVRGDELEIYNEHCLRDALDVVARVASPSIRSLSLSGEGAIITTGKIHSDQLNVSVSGTGSFDSQDSVIAANMSVDLSGTGSISLMATCTSMNSTNSGTGSIIISGAADSHSINTSGTGNFHGYGFITKTASVSISGSCNVELYVTDSLDVTISGSGNVYYKGTPVITTHISGSGSLIHVD